MKTLLISFLICTLSIAYSQNSVEWKGGTPGQMDDWSVASNWSNNRVPDVFSHVIIKANNNGHNAQPILEHKVEVASITLLNGAKLTVDKGGEITIDGRNVFTFGLLNYGGKIKNYGMIKLYELEKSLKSFSPLDIMGSGKVYIDGKIGNASFASNN
jgi:hypothetical protein